MPLEPQRSARKSVAVLLFSLFFFLPCCCLVDLLLLPPLPHSGGSSAIQRFREKAAPSKSEQDESRPQGAGCRAEFVFLALLACFSVCPLSLAIFNAECPSLPHTHIHTQTQRSRVSEMKFVVCAIRPRKPVVLLGKPPRRLPRALPAPLLMPRRVLLSCPSCTPYLHSLSSSSRV